jgi:hypothetical protein
MKKSTLQRDTNSVKFTLRKTSLLVTAGVVYLLGQYLRGQWLLNTKLDFMCHPYMENGKIYCHSLYQNAGFVFMAAGQVLAIAGIILLFANARGITTCWRFSRWYIPICTLIVIFFFPLPIFPVVAPTGRETAVVVFGSIYIFVTFCIVLWSFFGARRSGKI